MLCVGLPVLAAAVPQRDDAPASAVVGRAHDISRELLALRRVVRVGHEAAAVVVDDVVLVLAGLADTGVGDGEHVVLVHIVEPATCCQPADTHVPSAWATCQQRIFVPSALFPPARDTRQLRLLPASMRYKPGPFQSDMVRWLGRLEEMCVGDVGLGSVGDDVGLRKSNGAAGRGFL